MPNLIALPIAQEALVGLGLTAAGDLMGNVQNKAAAKNATNAQNIAQANTAANQQQAMSALSGYQRANAGPGQAAQPIFNAQQVPSQPSQGASSLDPATAQRILAMLQQAKQGGPPGVA